MARGVPYEQGPRHSLARTTRQHSIAASMWRSATASSVSPADSSSVATCRTRFYLVCVSRSSLVASRTTVVRRWVSLRDNASKIARVFATITDCTGQMTVDPYFNFPPQSSFSFHKRRVNLRNTFAEAVELWHRHSRSSASSSNLTPT